MRCQRCGVESMMLWSYGLCDFCFPPSPSYRPTAPSSPNRPEPIDITHLGDKPKDPPLSFRDQCAIAAMRAIIELQHSTNRDDNEETIDDPQVASMAFDLAEAMEAERTKRNAKG